MSTLQLEDDQKFVLMKFRRSISDVAQLHHNDYFLARWLRARSWNEAEAEKMLREHFRWRKLWEVDGALKTWKPPEVLERYCPSGTIGYDQEGAPIIILPFAGLDIVGILHSTSRQDLVRIMIQILEANMKMAADTGVNKLVVILDMEGFILRPYAWRPAAETVISLIQMYEANYPEVLKACYIVNAPRVFSIAFTVVKRFLNEYTIGKISIYKSDPKKWKKVLREHLPVDILPKHFGGEAVDPIDGDAKCPSIVKQGGVVPKSFYKNTYSKSADENIDFNKVVIKKGNKITLDFISAEEGCFLKWEFYTESHDIRFGITCTDEDGNQTAAIRFRRVAAHQLNEAGVIACQAPATYTVVFDNTYSYMRSKTLHYYIAVTPPIDQMGLDSLVITATDGSENEQDKQQSDSTTNDDVKM